MNINHHKLYITVALATLNTVMAGCASQPVERAAPPQQAEASAGNLAQRLAEAERAKVPVGASAEENAKADQTGDTQAVPEMSEAARKAKADSMKLIPGTGVFVKPPAPAVPAAGAQDIVLNFEGADIREVIRVVLGDMLHENYVIDARVNGLVTLHTSQPVAKSAVAPILDSVLRMNGAAMVKEEGVYKISPIAVAVRGSVTPQMGNLPPGYSVQVVQLQYIAAREMAKILEPLVPEGSIMRVDETRNLLILAGGENEIRHALETIGVFDLDWLAGMSVGLFTLQSTDLKSILPELELLFGEKSKGPFAGLVRVIPIERMNAVFVVTSRPQYLEQARIWVERLDRNGSKGGTRLFVYSVQNGKAEKIAALLSQIIGGKSAQGTQASIAPGLSGTELQTSGSGMGQSSGFSGGSSTSSLMNKSPANSAQSVVASGSGEGLGLTPGNTVKVIADKDNNALLILANALEYEKIEEAVKKLDVVARQVLVEVTVAEVILTGELKYGLEWYFNNANNISGQLTNAGALAPTIGAVAPKQPFTAIWSGPGGNVKAVLSALAADSKLNILSSPHIMVTDNQAAQIKVGDSVPIAGTTTVTTSGTPITSVQYVDTGILLEVRPHINAGGLVTMEIKQEVSDPAPTTTSGLVSPTINKRSAQSIVAVQSGETMVLGGLIKDTKNNSSGGLPFLSEIPVLGALFGSQYQKDYRSELVIMITPRVVNNSQQAREVTDEFRRKLSRIKYAPPFEAWRSDKSNAAK